KFISRELEPEMRQITNSSRRLSEHISRALNKIRKPSTAEESPSCSIVTWSPKTGPPRQKMSQSGCGTPETQRCFSLSQEPLPAGSPSGCHGPDRRSCRPGCHRKQRPRHLPNPSSRSAQEEQRNGGSNRPL